MRGPAKYSVNFYATTSTGTLSGGKHRLSARLGADYRGEHLEQHRKCQPATTYTSLKDDSGTLTSLSFSIAELVTGGSPSLSAFPSFTRAAAATEPHRTGSCSLNAHSSFGFGSGFYETFSFSGISYSEYSIYAYVSIVAGKTGTIASGSTSYGYTPTVNSTTPTFPGYTQITGA